MYGDPSSVLGGPEALKPSPPPYEDSGVPNAWWRKTWVRVGTALVVGAFVAWQAGAFDDVLYMSDIDASETSDLTRNAPSDWQQVEQFSSSHGFVLAVPPSMGVMADASPQYDSEGSAMLALIADFTDDAGSAFMVMHNQDADYLTWDPVALFESDPDAVSSELGIDLDAVDWVTVDGLSGFRVTGTDPATSEPACLFMFIPTDSGAIAFAGFGGSSSDLRSLCDDVAGTIRWIDS